MASSISQSLKATPDDHLHQEEKISKWVILPDNRAKLHWDVFMYGLLLFICTVTPFHIAFTYRSFTWCVLYYTLDLCFVFDILVCFSTAIPETEEKD
jgi:hypothetical protein